MGVPLTAFCTTKETCTSSRPWDNHCHCSGLLGPSLSPIRPCLCRRSLRFSADLQISPVLQFQRCWKMVHEWFMMFTMLIYVHLYSSMFTSVPEKFHGVFLASALAIERAELNIVTCDDTRQIVTQNHAELGPPSRVCLKKAVRTVVSLQRHD